MKPTWVVVPGVFLVAATGWAQTSFEGVSALPSVGVEWGTPYNFSASLRCDVFFWVHERGAASGSGDSAFVLQPVGSIGLGGSKAGLGLGLAGDAGIFTGRVAVSRTFSHPLGAESNQTWVGGELEWSYFHLVSLQAGLMAPRGGGDTRFTWAVGIGLPVIDPRDLPCPGCH